MSTKPPYTSMSEPTTTALCPFLLVGVWVCTYRQTQKHEHTNSVITSDLQTVFSFVFCILFSVLMLIFLSCLGVLEPTELQIRCLPWFGHKWCLWYFITLYNNLSIKWLFLCFVQHCYVFLSEGLVVATADANKAVVLLQTEAGM